MTTYRITYRDSSNEEQQKPIIAESAHLAVQGLVLLGYDIKRFVHSFPAV